MKRPSSRERRQARIAKQVAQPALLTDRIQPLRRPVLRLKKP
jgi:hypothetical protein